MWEGIGDSVRDGIGNRVFGMGSGAVVGIGLGFAMRGMGWRIALATSAGMGTRTVLPIVLAMWDWEAGVVMGLDAN